VDHRFLLDAMLGSLARWLRIGGVDSEYRRDIDDEELIKEAQNTGRILLTRDAVLVQRAKKNCVDAFLIPFIKDREILRLLIKVYSLKLDVEKSRCPKCNGTLSSIQREDVKPRVPEGTWNNAFEFWECLLCGSVYWRGSHWENISSTIVYAMQL
jgi:uncharacterized protein with PIN domain